MPFPSAPPKFAQTTDPNKQFTTGMGNTALDGSLAAGMTPSRADVEFMRRMREVRISRGEDPSTYESDVSEERWYADVHKMVREMHD